MAKKPKMFNWASIALPLAAVLATAACSGGGAASGSSIDKREEASGPVTVWVGSWWESEIPKIKQAWEKDHPGIELTIEALPVNGYLDKFTAASLGGTPPDAVALDSSWISTVAAKGLLEPLDKYTADLPKDDFLPAIWDSSHYKDNMYAIPDRGESGVYFYNKTVFDAAGVTYPTDSWTHDDMLDIAKKLTIPGKQYGIGLPADVSDPSGVTSVFDPILWSSGGEYLNEDNTKAAINSPEGVRAVTYWSEIYTKYHAAPEGSPNFSMTRDIAPMFEANQVGLIGGSSNTFDQLSKNANLRWGTVLSPDGGINRGGGWAFGVPTGAKNAAAALEFVKWYTEPANLGTLANRMPSRKSAREFKPWNDPKYAVFAKSAPMSKAEPRVDNWAQIQTVVITELQKVLIGHQSPQQAAAAMELQINTILAG